MTIIGVWIFSIILSCIPLFGICGHYGYDAVEGVCHWMSMMCPQAWIILVVGDGLPCLVVLHSYGMVYINLAQASKDEDTSNQRRAVIILTISYLVHPCLFLVCLC